MANPPDLVVRVRPIFAKVAPVVREHKANGKLPFRIVHPGQQYDEAMTNVPVEEFQLPAPNVHLEAGSGCQGTRTARILERYEANLLRSHAPAMAVFDDVNSTVACAFATLRLGVPVDQGMKTV